MSVVVILLTTVITIIVVVDVIWFMCSAIGPKGKPIGAKAFVRIQYSGSAIIHDGSYDSASKVIVRGLRYASTMYATFSTRSI